MRQRAYQLRHPGGWHQSRRRFAPAAERPFRPGKLANCGFSERNLGIATVSNRCRPTGNAPACRNFRWVAGVSLLNTRVESASVTHSASSPGLRHGLPLRGPTPLLRLQSDERLVALVRRGHDSAYEALVSRYNSRLLAFCRHMLASKEDAEDVLQEVFAAAYNAMLADNREDQRAAVALPDRAQPQSEPPPPRTGHRRRLDGHPLRRGRPVHRRQGLQARGVPAPRRGRPEPAGDAAHRAPPPRDRRPLLRADLRGHGDDHPRRQVAARARSRLARRGVRIAPHELRRGAPRAGRRRRGPGEAHPASAAPRQGLPALRRVPRASALPTTGRSPPSSRSAPSSCSRSFCSSTSAPPPPRRTRQGPRAAPPPASGVASGAAIGASAGSPARPPPGSPPPPLSRRAPSRFSTSSTLPRRRAPTRPRLCRLGPPPVPHPSWCRRRSSP